MRLVGEAIVLAATDLSDHVNCSHLTTLNLTVARGALGAATNYDPLLDILAERGRAHEAAYLEHLRALGHRVEAADGLPSPIELMREGVAVIVQARLEHGAWTGRADLLVRVERRCAHWPWSYEVIDTKLSTETRAGAVLQLCVYSDLLSELQGHAPDEMHIVRPGAEFPRDSYRFEEYAAFYRVLRADLQSRTTAGLETYPEPTAHCASCRWRSRCDGQRRRDDHLTLVADLGRLHQRELTRNGIATVAALAAVAPPWPHEPERGARATYDKLIDQARLQVAARTSQPPPYELLPVEPARGLARLPDASPGDVFLDLEGDPFIADGGREYLFGWATDDGTYVRAWAMDDAGERAGFEQLIDTIMARWANDPGMHVYHYAPYEPSALKRLMGRYATRADELDRLLRGQRLVDLYSITRQALRAGVESYSIKSLEPIIGYTRALALDDAGASMRGVRLALQRGFVGAIDPSWPPQVEAYNCDDCRSAARLRDWLEARRAELIAAGAAIERPPLLNGEPEEVTEVRTRAAEVAARLLAGIPDNREARTPEQHATWLLGHLMEWYSREGKVAWWEYFRLAALPDDERLDDQRAIAGLEHIERIPDRQIPIDRYRFPPQEVFVKAGDDVGVDANVKVGSVAAIDPANRTVAIKKRRDSIDLHPSSVFASSMIAPKPKDAAIVSIGEAVANRGFPPAAQPSLLRDLLQRVPPRSVAAASESLRRPDETIEACATRLALALDGTVLPIQGPPGTGKTETAGAMIVALVGAGRRVGVTATSHAVIANLVARAVGIAARAAVPLRALLKSDAPDGNALAGIEYEPSAARAEAQVPNFNLIGGTPWQWARDGMAGSVDVLFIDEAGQMSLADAVAVTRSARSLVLVGDPQQLEQPIQGSHPDGVAVSVLEHLLGDHPTIARDRGLFLDETHRLHPTICELTAEQFYERRLRPDADVHRQAIQAPPISAPGLYWMPVEHRGNQNRSVEEADAVARLVARCLAAGATWTDQHGETLPLTPSDILIVAPFNAHVAAIRDALTARGVSAVRVGTVDKFQGQQATIAIYSMATSHPDDAPRGLEFLYDRHRLNVATSRPRCASILVASPALLRPTCTTPRHLHLASALSRYVELSQLVP